MLKSKDFRDRDRRNATVSNGWLETGSRSPSRFRCTMRVKRSGYIFATPVVSNRIRVMAIHARGWLLPALCVAVSAAGADDRLSSEATAYLDGALAILQQHFLHKDKIDWTKLKQETFAQAARAQTPVDTYPAIRFALAKLGDNHSYLQLTPELARDEKARGPKLADPSAMPPPRARKISFPFPSPFRTRRVPEGAMVVGASASIAQIVVPLFASPSRKE